MIFLLTMLITCIQIVAFLIPDKLSQTKFLKQKNPLNHINNTNVSKLDFVDVLSNDDAAKFIRAPNSLNSLQSKQRGRLCSTQNLKSFSSINILAYEVWLQRGIIQTRAILSSLSTLSASPPSRVPSVLKMILTSNPQCVVHDSRPATNL